MDVDTLDLRQMLDLIPTAVYSTQHHEWMWFILNKCYINDEGTIIGWQIGYQHPDGGMNPDWELFEMDVERGCKKMLTRLLAENHLN